MGGASRGRHQTTSRWRLARPLIHTVPAIFLTTLLILTAVGATLAGRLIHDQNQKLLKERANEVSLVFDTSVSAIPAALEALGHVASDGGTRLFTEVADQYVVAGPGHLSFALIRRSDTGFVVTAASGADLRVGQQLTGPVLAALADAADQSASSVVATPVIGSGVDRMVGFAIGGPSVPAGTVVYRESALGPVAAPREAKTAPFNELKVVLYATPEPDPGQVLVTTTQDLIPKGSWVVLPLSVGDIQWSLAVSAVHPLVGFVTQSIPWVAVAVGVILSLLVALLLDQLVRRRDMAEAMYQTERNLAKNLQRRLLPSVPAVVGLDVASRYLTASEGQEVGGDWFDAFDLGEGRAGVAIGDVVGHDIEAAAAMAQVRSALRAYAWEGGDPAGVLERLGELVEAFRITPLVSAIYGIIDPPGADGSRLFRWANAGHLPPLLILPGQEADLLEEGSSAVIGAPIRRPRAEGSRILPAGATLLLYTDGLVERRGVPINDSLEQLRRGIPPGPEGLSADATCDRILAGGGGVASRDDIAMVAMRIPDLAAPVDGEVLDSRGRAR